MFLLLVLNARKYDALAENVIIKCATDIRADIYRTRALHACAHARFI